MLEYLIENPTVFHLTDSQWDTLTNWCASLLLDLTKRGMEDASGVVMRLGLIVYRICMDYTAMRKYEWKLNNPDVYCYDTDFVNIMHFAKVLYNHSVEMFESLPKKEPPKTTAVNRFLNALPNDEEFSRSLAK